MRMAAGAIGIGCRFCFTGADEACAERRDGKFKKAEAAAAMVCGKAESETWETYTLSAVSGAAGRHGMDEKGWEMELIRLVSEMSRILLDSYVRLASIDVR